MFDTPPKEAAWQVLERVTAKRKSLLAAGYTITPANGKNPFLPEWQNIEITDAVIEGWAKDYPAALNTGLRTRHTPGVDIDVLDEAVAEELQDLLWLMIGDNGHALVRYGRRPKRAVLFQTNEPFGKLSTSFFVSPDGRKHRVEVLCNGQQFIAHGIHPDTGAAYEWEGGEPASVPRDGLPHLSVETAKEFVAKAAEVMRKHGWIVEEKIKKKTADKKLNGSRASSTDSGGAEFDAIYGVGDEERARDALRYISAEDRDVWLNIGMALKTGLGEAGRALWDNWSMGSEKYDATDQDKVWDSFKRSGVSLGTLFHYAKHAGWQSKADEAGSNNNSPPPPLRWLDMSNWDSEPAPIREWAILDRSPLNQVGLFSGHGGTGKSIAELTKDVAHVTGRDWLRSMPALGPAFYIGAEDDEGEIHRRLADIAAHYGVTFKELTEGGLYVLCLLGEDATLCAANRKSGKVETTELCRQIYEAAGDIKPKNISVDTLSRAFAGNEIDRVEVYAFAMHMQKLAMVAGGAVTVLSHPSLQGMSSGSGISGSTAWHNAFRFRHYLKGVKPGDGEQPDNDLRELEFLKNQYGSLGERVILRYRNGLFLPEPGISNLDKAVREARIEELFIAGLGQIVRQGRDAIYGGTSSENGPALIAQLPEVKKERISKSELVRAMNQLLAANKIHVGKTTDGAPSKRKRCLMVGPTPRPL